MYAQKRPALRLKSTQYRMIGGVLFWQNYDKVLIRCLEKNYVDHILTKLRDGPTSGHFNGETTTHKALRAGYYFPTLFIDAHAHA